jgi:hypothetical protein
VLGTCLLPYILGTVSFRSDTCAKWKNANPISYQVEPEQAWRLVVLNRWRRLCPPLRG